MRFLFAACFVIAAAGLLTACPGTTPNQITITQARYPAINSGVCDWSSNTLYAEGISVDLATASGANWYFGWSSNLERGSLVVGSDTVTAANHNDFEAKSVTLNYKSTPAIDLPSETLPLSAYLPAGGLDTSNYFGIPILTSKTVAELAAKIPGPTTVVATFTVSGNLVSGDAVTTNPFSFPVQVYNSGFVHGSCSAPTPYEVPLNGLCQQGVDAPGSYCSADAGVLGS